MARPSKYDWENIRLDLQAGKPQEYVHKKYDVPYNSLANHLKKNPISINEQAVEAIASVDHISEVINEVNEQNPKLADRVIDLIEEKHPQFKKAMVGLSAKLFNRMNTLADTATASEVPQLAKGMQTITDTLGVSQRHANQIINNTNAQQNVIEAKEPDF